MQKVQGQPRQDERLSPETVSRGGVASKDTDNVLSLLARAPQKTNSGREHDWSAALKLAHQTVEAVRASADRTEKMEVRAHALWARATEEIKRAQARIEELEACLQMSEARANEAERQVKETQEWARRIHDAIVAELSVGATLLQDTRGIAVAGATHDSAAATSAISVDQAEALFAAVEGARHGGEDAKS